jgi:tRNA-specific 2-thiouridylase
LTVSPPTVTAIGLLSGGLDSLLAARIIALQGIRVVACHFISPFFGWEAHGREAEKAGELEKRLGVQVLVRSIWPEYLEVVRHPRHGYGKNLNPCVDCKIFMVAKAAEIMREMGASFVFTGEVLGQRPMSQRRNTLHVIENEAGLKGCLVRPLSAKLLPPSRPEIEGLLDRKKLLDFKGRGRRPQRDLARDLGLTDYPAPAGGCLLTDETYAGRLRKLLLREEGVPALSEVVLLSLGRHFDLGGGVLLAVGRNESENARLAAQSAADDILFSTPDIPGPTSLLRGPANDDQVALAASIDARYADARPAERVTVAIARGGLTTLLSVSPVHPAEIETLRA